MPTKEDIKKYQKQLEEARTHLLSEIVEIEKGGKPINPRPDVEDIEDLANDAEETGNAMSVAFELKERVGAIDAALNRIASGTYGVCKNCGGEISKKVLNIVPESGLCENCKKSL